MEFAFNQGLQHIIIWEIAQDVHPNATNPNPHKTSLLRAAFNKKLALHSALGDYDDDGDVDANDYLVWRTTSRAAPRVLSPGRDSVILMEAKPQHCRDVLIGSGNRHRELIRLRL